MRDSFIVVRVLKQDASMF